MRAYIVHEENWAFKYPARKKYKLLFHKGSSKKKVLKYGTPKPRKQGALQGSFWALGLSK